MIDIIIIGGGIIGTSIARELSRYHLKITLLEAENDIACGTTKANSAIIHAGYDPTPGTLKARYNVRGNKMMEELCQELQVPFQRIGSLVTAFSDEEVEVLKELKNRGRINGVSGLQILTREEVLFREPHIQRDVRGGLYAPTAGIVGPWELAIALAENAADNGVEIYFDSPVTDIQRLEGGYIVKSGDKRFESRMIINCAGIHADQIHNMVFPKKFEILPGKGEYNLFDKEHGKFVGHIVFRCPSPAGKGIVILPTVHGNLLLGPTSVSTENRDYKGTSWEGLIHLERHVKETVKDLNMRGVITSFTGIRAGVKEKDFIIEEAELNSAFIDVAGIDSPGLTAAPAIAEEVSIMVKRILGNVDMKPDFRAKRRPSIRFMEITDEDKQRVILENPLYGNVICRCEHITEGEIVDAIRRNVGAKTVDGVKRRVRPGSGRCQGSFCLPRVMEILSRETGIPFEDIQKDGNGSWIVTGFLGGQGVQEPEGVIKLTGTEEERDEPV